MHTSRKNAKCSFNTFLNDNANDAIYENDGHSFFKKQAAMNLNQNVCISKKHGVYLTHIASLAYTSITFDNEFSYLITASNLVHIWPKEGWSGEVLNDNLVDNKIDIENNRTSFYIPKSGESKIQMMIWKNKMTDETDFQLCIRSIPIENYEENSEKQNNCTRVVVFNDIPSKFGINIKPNNKYQEIYIENDDVVCIFPAVSSYYVGSNMNIEVVNSYNQKASKHSSIQNYKYSENILYYYNYGSSYYSFIKLDYNTIESTGIVAFLNSESSSEQQGLVYYDFGIKDEFAIHSSGDNKYKYIEKGDDIIVSPSKTPTPSRSITSAVDYYQNVEIELNETNNHGYFDMERIRTLPFSCPKSTIFFIHYMAGFEARFYDYRRHGIDNKINQYSSSKIVYFGMSNGFMTVERINSHGASRNNQFVYSFVILHKINAGELIKTCESIYISSDPSETIIIKGPENDSKKI